MILLILLFWPDIILFLLIRLLNALSFYLSDRSSCSTCLIKLLILLVRSKILISLLNYFTWATIYHSYSTCLTKILLQLVIRCASFPYLYFTYLFIGRAYCSPVLLLFGRESTIFYIFDLYYPCIVYLCTFCLITCCLIILVWPHTYSEIVWWILKSNFIFDHFETHDIWRFNGQYNFTNEIRINRNFPPFTN